MTDDFFGLKKLEKDLKKSLSFDIFPEDKQIKKRRKFKQPRPKYTNQKPILTKSQQQETKKFIKMTIHAFKSLKSSIQNREIRKLEKETVKNIKNAEALAHKLKTLQENNDALIDIERYQKELLKLSEENKQSKKIEYEDDD